MLLSCLTIVGEVTKVHVRIQAAMIPRDKIVCSAPDQPLLPLLKQND
jgi:hypothetical protein